MLRLIAGVLFGAWLVLALLGKGGFVHLLFLNFLGLAVTEFAAEYRSRLSV
ncbi:MAG: hypothetical protein ABL959_18905 [Pyrinomonadaceae bacterium]